MKPLTLAVLLLSAFLVGCADFKMETVGSPNDYGAYPTNYTEIVHYWIKVNFKDPDSVKDLDIHKPVQFLWQNDNMWKRAYGYNIAFQCNAKNSYGGYTGLETSVLFVRDGVVLHDMNLSE